MTHKEAPRGILLAVAVHDDGQARLEPAAPDRIKVQAGHPVDFRISYRLADNPGGREEATVEGELRVGDGPALTAQVAMHDRPLLNDARLGDLQFHVPALPQGVHRVTYRVRLQTSDQDQLKQGRPTLQSTDVDGAIDVEAV